MYACIIRASFEVVKEVRILHFVSGSREFEISDRKLTIHGWILYLTYPAKQIFALSLIMI